MMSGIEKVFSFVAACIVGYAFGTQLEMIFQGQIFYNVKYSPVLQMILIAIITVIAFWTMLRKAAKE